MNKKYWIPALIAVMSLVLALIVISTQTKKKSLILKGEILRQDELLKKQDKKITEGERLLGESRKVYDEEIALRNGEIDSANAVIVVLEGKDVESAERIEELESIIPFLPPEGQELIEEWKSRFSLCQNIIGEKDKLIFSLSQKYEAEFSLRVDVEDQKTRVEQGRAEALDQVEDQAKAIVLLEKRLRTGQSVGLVKSVGISVAVAYIVYSLFLK